jgi:hypothetical protein
MSELPYLATISFSREIPLTPDELETLRTQIEERIRTILPAGTDIVVEVDEDYLLAGLSRSEDLAKAIQETSFNVREIVPVDA